MTMNYVYMSSLHGILDMFTCQEYHGNHVTLGKQIWSDKYDFQITDMQGLCVIILWLGSKIYFR